MSSNPSATLTRPRTPIPFCLATWRNDNGSFTCTRLDDHEGHCCDEIARGARNDRGASFECKSHDYDHSAEKGLPSEESQ